MNHQSSGRSPVAAQMPQRSSLRTLPSLRRSLRSLSRGRKAAEKEGSSRGDADSDHQKQDPTKPEGTASALRTPIEHNKFTGNNHHRMDGENIRTNRQHKECETDLAKESQRARRGRSRSRVRALLMRRGRNDGTATPSETPDTSMSPQAKGKDRGRSQSRLRRLLLGRDRSESRKRNGNTDGRATATMNTADPLGLQGCRDRQRFAAPDAGVVGAEQARSPYEFARFRSAVVEELPSDSGRGVNRNESGQLSELSALQQPPTDLLPIQSGVLAVTAASRRLMRSVSNLGMEDPVLREVGPVDVDLAVADDDDNDVASILEDRTATSEDGGGFDRRMFDQLLLLEANVKEWIRAVHETSPDSHVEGHREGTNDGPRAPKVDLNESAALDASRSSAIRKERTAQTIAGSLVADEPTADSTARESVQPPRKLDVSRSSRAFQSILESAPSTERAPSYSKQPLSQSEVDTVLAALAHSHKKQLKSRRNRRQSLDMADLGSDRQRISTDGEEHAKFEEGHHGFSQPRDAHTSLLGGPLPAASTHSLRSVDRAPTNRVVVKVRVKRRSTLHCAPGIVGSEFLRAPNVYRVPPSASVSASSLRGDATKTVARADDPSAAASASSATVQELMSRPRLLPDMDSVFA